MIKHVRVAKEDNINWQEYYASIRSVCPWSYKAYMNDTILVIDYNPNCFKTWSCLFKGTKYEAFVYKMPEITAEDLETLCDYYNETLGDKYNSEYLWSHHEEGGDSAPAPILIQQDKAQLKTLRDKIGYTDD